MGNRSTEKRIAQEAILQAQLTSVGEGARDWSVLIDILAGTGDAGGWTKAITSGGLKTVTRTPATATESFWIPVIIPTRSTVGRGILPIAVVVNYSVGTADATDVRAELWKVTAAQETASPTAAELFGAVNGDYDPGHQTAADRGLDTSAPQLHRVTSFNDADDFLGEDESLYLRFVVVDPGSSVVILRHAHLMFQEVPLDLE